MSDWQVGDLAVCVDASELRGDPFKTTAAQLRTGSTYKVVGLDDRPDSGLFLAGITAAYQHVGYGWRADRFRKITPDKYEACEDEFVTLLKRSKVSA